MGAVRDAPIDLQSDGFPARVQDTGPCDARNRRMAARNTTQKDKSNRVCPRRLRPDGRSRTCTNIQTRQKWPAVLQGLAIRLGCLRIGAQRTRRISGRILKSNHRGASHEKGHKDKALLHACYALCAQQRHNDGCQNTLNNSTLSTSHAHTSSQCASGSLPHPTVSKWMPDGIALGQPGRLRLYTSWCRGGVIADLVVSAAGETGVGRRCGLHPSLICKRCVFVRWTKKTFVYKWDYRPTDYAHAHMHARTETHSMHTPTHTRTRASHA